MPLPTVAELAAALDLDDYKAVKKARAPFSRGRGLKRLAPQLMQAFPRLTKPAARVSVMFWLCNLSRQLPEVVDLAVKTLDDDEYLVRMHACAALAYSLRRDALPHLRKLRKHPDQQTREDAAAAIDAITQQNQDYWHDRDHEGNIHWALHPDDEASAGQGGPGQGTS
jgi:HEAT repeat protein